VVPPVVLIMITPVMLIVISPIETYYATPAIPPLSVVLSVAVKAAKVVVQLSAKVLLIMITPIETYYATLVTPRTPIGTYKVKPKGKVRDNSKALIALVTHPVLQVL